MKAKISQLDRRYTFEGFPPNTKKKYSGSCTNWVYTKTTSKTKGKEAIKQEWEFAFKQKKLKETKKYLIDDYNSKFIVFTIHWLQIKDKLERCLFYLDSVDDTSFYINFDSKHITSVKVFIKNNYKTLTLDILEDFLITNCGGVKL